MRVTNTYRDERGKGIAEKHRKNKKGGRREKRIERKNKKKNRVNKSH